VSDPDIGAQIQRGLRRLTYATVVLFIALGVVGVFGWHDAVAKRHDLQREEMRTNRALCTLRGDLADRVRASEDFLINHPAGIPGVPAATIRSNLNGQRRTVAALSNLHCAPTG
jgi:hypothetical protein